MSTEQRYAEAGLKPPKHDRPVSDEISPEQRSDGLQPPNPAADNVEVVDPAAPAAERAPLASSSRSRRSATPTPSQEA